MKTRVIAISALVVGILLGGFGVEALRPVEPPDPNLMTKAAGDSVMTENFRLHEANNRLTHAMQFLEEEVTLARAAKEAAKKSYPKNAKAAYDSGLDAMRDSLSQVPNP